MTNLHIEVEPGGKTLGIQILEAEEPDLPESDCAYHLVKKLPSRSARLDGKLQLGIHAGDAHIYLQEHRNRPIYRHRDNSNFPCMRSGHTG